MGNTRSCASSRPRKGCTKGCVVPDKDPLLPSMTQRIVRADIARDFEVLPQVLGTGYSGAVHLGAHHATKKQVAIKQFSKRSLKAERLHLLQSEVEVHLHLDHPNVCRLLHAYEDRRAVWLVMELCACELYSRLCERRAFVERDAADLVMQMLQAVAYLHHNRIVHRDLKLENWMCSTEESDDRLKLIDFGFSRILRSEETLEKPCGTLHYTSPEVLQRNYTSQCDMWSLGVVCYMLLLGRAPFKGSTNVSIAKAILYGDFSREGRWNDLSGAAQDFLSKLLRKNPGERLDAKLALEHPWITGHCSPPSVQCNIGVDVLRSLRRFAHGSHLQRAALTMLAYSFTSQELQDLEKTFLALDRSGRGTITLEQLASVLREHHDKAEGDASLSQEVSRLLEQIEGSPNEEMDMELHYTPFVAAMLATRVRQHEEKVHEAFAMFTHGGREMITAEGLLEIFSHVAVGAGEGETRLTPAEAEEWVRQADYKGIGGVDYESFLASLTGRHLWALPTPEELEAQPAVRVFDSSAAAFGRLSPRARSCSDSQVKIRQLSRRSIMRHRLAQALIDSEADGEDGRGGGEDSDEEEEQRPHTFSPGDLDGDTLKFRGAACQVDERYFA